jgi:hypothetical protein
MRSLALIALVTLAAFPLSAHDHWREPRRAVVAEAPRCAPSVGWEGHSWENRWERHGWYRRHDRDDARVILRPVALPFQGRVDLRFR